MSTRKCRAPIRRGVESCATRRILCCAIAMLLAASAQAQDDRAGNKAQSASAKSKASAQKETAQKEKAGKDAVQLDAVVVTGVRGSIIKSQAIKRDSDQIVDSVSAEDIGALPDRSVTETLQRVSGVTIDHFFARNDPDHFSAEGSGVMVRGMTQVRGELNGRDIFSANSGRGLSFEDVPAEMMAGVDVYKNPSADIIEGGLGGTVNLRTFRPFDFKGLKVASSIDVNRGDMSKENKPSGSFLLSDRWNTSHGEFGALIDVAYSELATQSQGIQVEPYYRRTTNDGLWTSPYVLEGSGKDEVYVPGGVNWRTLDFERKRTGIAAALQWRPDDDSLVTLQYMRSKYNMNWAEHAAFFGDTPADSLPNWGTTYSFDDDGVFQSGSPISYSWRNALSYDGSLKFVNDTRYATQQNMTEDISLGFQRYLTDQTLVSADAQLVRSTSDQFDFTVADGIYLPGLSFDLTGKYPQVSIADTAYAADQSNYYWYSAMDHIANNRGREVALRIDLEHTFNDSAWMQKLRFGVRSTDRHQVNKSSTYNWGVLSESWASLPGATDGLAWANQYLADQSELFSFGNFFNGDVSVPSNMWFPKLSLVKNYAQASQLLQALWTARGYGWSPVEYGIQDVNVQQERTQTAYGVLYFGNEDRAVPIDGNVGVRVVGTKSTGSGYGSYPDFVGGSAAQEWQDIYQGQYFPIDGHNSYTDVLPSLNVRLKFTDSLQWRFAASKAISRPSMDQLKASLVLSAGLDTDGQPTTWTGSGQNPWLKPMRANQFDTALEWYFDNSDMLYATLFYKNVKDYIAYQTRTEQYTLNGDTRDYQVTRPYNMDKGKIKGFEVGYNQFFDSLPGWLGGFGISANYTWIDSDGSPLELITPVDKTPSGQYMTLPLEGLSKRSYNVALIYEKYALSFRLAYNWRSRYLLTTSDASTGLPTWSDDYGQLDASMFYNINSHLKIGIQANNLTNAVTKTLMGPSGYTDGEIDTRLYNRGWFINDRRYAVVLRANW